ncbi:hypothetical protein IQ07DRAFT_638348 [Pyrenochaeta sp. DS3sAY3a]|nr:hypothetical protein IQ07DRAFT_638348 [Pyrenochaeta sp. DS3sAY3a]
MEGPTSSNSVTLYSMTDHDQMASPERPALSPSLSPISRDMIRIQVGKGKDVATFELPSDALRDSSDYFRTLLKPEWTPKADTSIRSTSIPDIEADIFGLYAEWLSNGAEILTDEFDWKMKYLDYLHWQSEIEEAYALKTTAPVRPEGFWDFGLTVMAWFMGGYLQSPSFQDHCLGHLYFLNFRFDPLFISEEELDCDLRDGALYHQGTVAYIDLADVLLIWQQTDHDARSPPTRSEDAPWELDTHPLRRFCVDWLTRYWLAYEVSPWDHAATDDIDEMYKKCPDLACKLLRGLTRAKRPETVASLDAYWVGRAKYAEETVKKAEEAAWTHRR